MTALKPKHLILHTDEDHRGILRALQQRDADLAQQLALEHVKKINSQMKNLETAWLKMAAEEKSNGV